MTDDTPNRSPEPNESKKSIWSILGPGIVTGASDNDPSGIATYSQAGAKFGYGLLWMSLVTFPMLLAVEEMCARIGLVSGKGLSELIKENHSKQFLYSITSLLLAANTINIGADIGAMSASLRLIIPDIPFVASTFLFTGIILAAEIVLPYRTYSRVLKYLTFALLFYIVTAFLVIQGGSQWLDILNASIIPHLELNKSFILMVVAVLGTTISPYLFFWQTSQEVEEEVKAGSVREMGEENIGKPKVTTKILKDMRIDVFAGMSMCQLIFWFIIITTASTLHQNGLTDIVSAEEAARALEPLVKGSQYSGQLASVLFASGIIGTGLLSVPVLAATSSYAVSEELGWKEGLYKKFQQAPKFYGIIIASTVIGLWINFSDIDPIQALIYAAVINGFISIPLLVVILKIANDKKVLGDKVNGKISNVISIITVVVLAVAAAAMVVYQWFIG
jgi:NRAMP (natural resistance-associated macrophage protein)-like metal ion transporter